MVKDPTTAQTHRCTIRVTYTVTTSVLTLTFHQRFTR